MRLRFLALVFLAAACLASAKRLITHEDVWLMKRVGAPIVSPNGKQLLFSVTEPSYDAAQQVSDLWIAPADGSQEPRRLTATKAAETSPVWSPDSQRIAFTTRRDGDEVPQVYVLDLRGGEAMRITSLSTGASHPDFSPDGKQLLFESMIYPRADDDAANKKIAAERKGRKYNARVYDSMPVRFWDSWLDDRRPHVFLVDIDSQKAVDLLAGSKLAAMAGFAGFNDGLSSGQTLQSTWAPDGQSIVFAAIVNRDQMMHTQTEAQLFRVGVKPGSEPQQLTKGEEDYSSPVFSPDGQTLYAKQSRRSTKRLYSNTRLASMSWPDGQLKTITESFDRSVGTFTFSADARVIYFNAEDDGFLRVFSMPAAGGTPKSIIDLTSGGYTSVSMGGNTLAGSWNSAAHPAEVVVIDPATGKHRVVTHFNDARLAELDLPPVEHFWMTAKDGRRVHSLIVFPPNIDKSKKYPLVLFPHGGPNGMSSDSFSFRWNYHFLASPGYVYLMTDYIGSTGFGEQFANDVESDVLRGPAKEILEAADEALKRYPFLDANRQAAVGASYGGYLMNWFEGTTGTRFKCLVNHAGAVNNESQYGINDGGIDRELRMGPPIWDALKPGIKNNQWIDQSPIRYADKWQTPMLITQGEGDFRVPLSESMTTFKVLQRRQIPSRIIFFPEAIHWVLKGEDNRFHMQEVQAWLGKYLN